MPTSTNREKAKFWRDPDLGDLELLRATYITHAFSKHTHEGYAIGVIEQGAEGFAYQGANHTASAGSIVVIHPGEVHTGQAATEDGWTYRMLYPATELIQRAASELSERQLPHLPYFPNPVIHDPELARWFRQLHVTLETSPSRLEREACFLWTMAQMVSRYADDRPIPSPVGRELAAVERVRDYLQAHLSENVSLNELAAIAHLSPFKLIRAFRQQFGLPPHAYLNQIRVQWAKRLLATGWGIAETAFATGFTDQSHFTRHFKRMWGITPGQYVAGCNNVQDGWAPSS